MSNLYQMMRQTGSLPGAPKRREMGRIPASGGGARWSDDDPDSVLSSPRAVRSNRAPYRIPPRQETPVVTKADTRDIFRRPSLSKDDDDANSNGCLPAPKKRGETLGQISSALWSDDDTDSVISSTRAGGSNKAPYRISLREGSPVITKADTRDIFLRPSSKDHANSNGFLRTTSSGAFEQERYGRHIADCNNDISVISNPKVTRLGHDDSGNAPKTRQRLSLIDSEATRSITSSEGSFSTKTLDVEDLSVFTDEENFVFEDDNTEELPEFTQCFPTSMDLLESDNFDDAITHVSCDDCDTVCDSSILQVEAFKGDLWAEMHSKSRLPVASAESRKQNKYNRYRDLQAPCKKEVEAAPRRFKHFNDISGEAKTQGIYKKDDEK